MKYIKGFDSLRAISIIFVLVSHLGLYYYLPETDFYQDRVWKLISGSTGVRIFFTLSGFLITSILISEKAKSGTLNFKNFYVRRFLRLLPPLLVFYSLVAILMNLEMIKSTLPGFLLSFFYLYNFVPNVHYTGELGHTWSLALEEQFYLTWPFVIYFFNKIRSFSIIIISILLLCVLGYYFLPGLEITNGFKPMRWFIPAVAPIMIGSYFALLNKEYGAKWKIIFEKKHLPLVVAILLFLFPLYAPEILLKVLTVVQSIGISMLLIWIMYNQESGLTKVLENKPLSYIGKISYGLYVYQGFFLKTGPGGDLLVQQFPWNILLTFIVAMVSFELIEKPALKLKKRFR